MKSKFVFAIAIFMSLTSSASVILRTQGAIHGGQARQRGFSLKDVRLELSPKSHFERISFEIGDQALKQNMGSPGYFHVENNPKSKIITISFTQTLGSAIDAKNLKQKLEKSYFIKNAEMLVDTRAHLTKLILHLMQPVSLRVTPIDGRANKSSFVKLDLFEDSILSGNRKK